MARSVGTPHAHVIVHSVQLMPPGSPVQREVQQVPNAVPRGLPGRLPCEQVPRICASLTMFSLDGNAFLSGHADGSIYRYFFEGGAQVRSHLLFAASLHYMLPLRLIPQGIFARHSCAPYNMAWGQHVAVSGCDRRIVFYDEQGQKTFSNMQDRWEFHGVITPQEGWSSIWTTPRRRASARPPLQKSVPAVKQSSLPATIGMIARVPAAC